MRLTSILFLAYAVAAPAGCSSGSDKAEGGAVDAPASQEAGGDQAGDAPDFCNAPLPTNTSCAATFAAQVADNPCDPDYMPVQTTCGRYRVWTITITGSESCVYDTTGGALVGTRSCGGQVPDGCAAGCTTAGLRESAYATCGAESAACP